MTFLWLLFAWAISFAVSLAPAFMPPMWLVLIALHESFEVPLLPLTLGAAVAGALGRFVLGLAAGRLSDHLPASVRADTTALGEWFDRRKRHKWLVVLAYCVGPLPSNVLFIVAGTGHAGLRGTAVCYGLSRMVSDTLWVWLGVTAASGLRAALLGRLADWRFLLAQLASLLALALVFRLPWARWLQGR